MRGAIFCGLLALGGGALAGETSDVLSQAALSLQAGDLLQGRLAVLAGTRATALDLDDGQGRHLRRLLDADGMARGAFAFVAQATGNYRLVVRGDAAGQGAGRPVLELSAPLSRAAQKAGADVPQNRLVAELAERIRSGQPDSAGFWQEVRQRGGTPLVEAQQGGSALVTFLWHGAPGTRNVRLFGSPSGEHESLDHLAGSDVWYRSYRVPASTRLSYQLAPDVPALPLPASSPAQRRTILATAQRDPLNPKVWNQSGGPLLDIWQGSSVLELPAAPPQPWVAERPGVARGTLEHHKLASKLLGNTRDVYLYRPPASAAAAATNLLLVFDAQAYVQRVPTPVILDNLLADGLLAPTAAIIVGNAPADARGDPRGRELPPNDDFVRFLSEELMPWARAQGVYAAADRTVVAGSSYGGLAAAYAGLRAPQWFGNVLSQSGSFWWAPDARLGEGAAQTVLADDRSEPGWLTRRFVESPRRPVRFYLEAGLFEAGNRGTDILNGSRRMRDVLRAQGYQVSYAEHASGHDYYQWRGTLACGMLHLLGDGPLPAACAAPAP